MIANQIYCPSWITSSISTFFMTGITIIFLNSIKF